MSAQTCHRLTLIIFRSAHNPSLRVIEVNRTGLASDKINVSGALANTGAGTVTVTNAGAGLQAGDTFTLFSGNKALSNGAALTVTGGGVIWNNKLAINGTIEIQSLVATTPTDISFSLSGTNLTLGWPPNYLTWTLQSNSVGIASSASWSAVPGSQTSTQMVFPIFPPWEAAPGGRQGPRERVEAIAALKLHFHSEWPRVPDPERHAPAGAGVEETLLAAAKSSLRCRMLLKNS